MAHHSWFRVVVLGQGFSVVVSRFPELACASSGPLPVQVPLAGLLWEALAAWESRGTHHAIQQPTNYTVTF